MPTRLLLTSGGKLALMRVFIPDSKNLVKEKQWIATEIKRIGEGKLKELAKQASVQRNLAYVPYSHYQVGVALLTKSGKTYLGNNVERVSFSETDHAEEAAITSAVVHGEVKESGRKFLLALACSHEGNTSPCGRCRQIMTEHADNCLVLTVDTKGSIRQVTSLKILLPHAFTPTDLGIE
jgi:cytidine deaminase